MTPKIYLTMEMGGMTAVLLGLLAQPAEARMVAMFEDKAEAEAHRDYLQAVMERTGE